MRHLLLSLLLLTLPQLAQADACGGENLFKTMPVDEANQVLSRAAEIPYGEGLLWQAQKAGQTLTLFGTYHLPHARTEAHLEALLAPAQTADVAYFEMNTTDMQTFEREIATKPGFMFVASGPTLPELLSESDWLALTSKMKARGFPPFMVAKMKPIFVTMMLGITPCKLKLMQSGAEGIDKRLAEALHSEGQSTRSIEHYSTAAKLFDAYPAEDQMEMLRLSLVETIDSDDMAETLFQMYLGQQIGLFWEFTRHVSLQYGGPTAEEDFALFEDLLLTKRNTAWIKELDAAQEASLFVAVGAAHLPGEEGLLNLLAQRGFTLTRLPFSP